MLLIKSVGGVLAVLPLGVQLVLDILVAAFVVFAVVNIVLSIVWVINQLKGLFSLL